MSQNKELTLPQIYKSIKIIPLFLMVGLVLMASLFLFLKKDTTPDTSFFNDYVVIAVAFFAGACSVLGSYLFRKKVHETSGKPLADKIILYNQAVILRFALLEGPALFALVLFFLSVNYLFMFIAGGMFLFMLVNRPTDDTIQQHLHLTSTDRKILEI